VDRFLANGQGERMNRTIKDATVQRFHDDSYDRLRQRLVDFVAAYEFVCRLKFLKGLTPYEHICNAGHQIPNRSASIPSIKCRG
jgi:hypothetical protein